MEIVFTQDYKVKDDTKKCYRKNETLTCSSDTADHFIKRGVAKNVSKVEPAKLDRSTGGNHSERAKLTLKPNNRTKKRKHKNNRH